MDQTNAVATTNKTKLSLSLINSAKDAKEMLDLPAIAENWERTYKMITGKPDGELRFNAERVLFLKAVADNKQLQEADKFSLYSAFTELAISGGTLRDGICYIVPMRGKAQFMPGWKYRLEQINELPNVRFCREPICVYQSDAFEYELGEKPKILSHKPNPKRADNEPILFVYWVIEFSHGTEVYIMDRAEVLRIRDQFSQSYKFRKAESMWATNEAEAFKKTIVKRVWKNLPKLPKHKLVDERLERSAVAGVDAEEAVELSKLKEQLQDTVLEDQPATESISEYEEIKEQEEAF